MAISTNDYVIDPNADPSWRKRLDELVEWNRSMIGIEITPRVTVFNTEVTRDNLRRFSECTANPNPLYWDDEYARISRFGRLVAPPNFMLTISAPNPTPNRNSGQIGAVDGSWVFNSHASADIEWYRTMALGDSLSFTHKLTSIVEKVGRQIGRAYLFTGEVYYWNQHHELLGKATGQVFFPEADSIVKGRKKRPEYAYSDDELRAIDKCYRDEPKHIRGRMPRYWEDVQVGEEIPTTVRGPMTQRDSVAWLVGGGGVPAQARSNLWVIADAEVSDLHKYPGQLPPTVEVNTAWLMLQNREGAHRFLTGSGLRQITGSERDPGGWQVPHEYEQQRYARGIVSLTHWMGDHGFLKRYNSQIRSLVQGGDVTWWKGRVTSKEIVNEEHLVHLNYWGENQLGEVVHPGSATMVLPSRG